MSLAYIANKSRRHDHVEALLAERTSPLYVRRARHAARRPAREHGGDDRLPRPPEDCAEEALLGATRALQIRDNPPAVNCLDLFAVARRRAGDGRRAATVLAATEAAREAMGVTPDENEEAIRALALTGLEGEVVEAAPAQRRGLDLPSALALAAGGGAGPKSPPASN